MSANLFGERFQILSFGESHGPALGVVIDGCPAGVSFDEALLFRELERRKPGQSDLTTTRSEADRPEILSGVYEGRTLGTPLAVLVRNEDARSQDYQQVLQAPRAGHADDVWQMKFGHRDPRGGGRSSGRETLSRVIGGSVAQMVLREAQPDLRVKAWTSRVGDLQLSQDESEAAFERDIDKDPARFPSALAVEAETKIRQAREAGDSLGGEAEIRLRGVPAGWGQPVFHKLKADLAAAFMSVGAVTSVELGEGSSSHRHSGVDFHTKKGAAVYGGIRGGISTGEEIRFRVGFKPTSSILDVAKKGRHDPFIVIRAIPVLEAMAHLVLVDHLLWSRTDRI